MTWWWAVPLAVAALAALVCHLGAHRLRDESQALRAGSAALDALVGARCTEAAPSGLMSRPSRTVESDHNR